MKRVIEKIKKTGAGAFRKSALLIPESVLVPKPDGDGLLRKEDAEWLAEMRSVLSPYWSARLSR